MKVRAKFTCRGNEAHADDPEMCNVYFEAVTEDSPDNEGFWKYTPAGNLSMSCVLRAATNFEVGKDYYLDILPAE